MYSFIFQDSYKRLDIFNDYSANINLLVAGLMQYIIIYLVFGGGKWVNEIKWMIGGDSKFANGFLWYIRICGTVISPLLITVIVVAFLYDMIVSQNGLKLRALTDYRLYNIELIKVIMTLKFQINAPGYKKWDPTIGSWAQDENGNDISYPYSAEGKV